MRFWDENTGALLLSGKSRLVPYMPMEDVRNACRILTGQSAVLPDRVDEDTVCFPAFGVPGGRLSCICLMRGGTLHAVELQVAAVGKRARPDAGRQRAFLFRCLYGDDPAKDSQRGVLLRCPFGTALVATDPRSGDATLRITYR